MKNHNESFKLLLLIFILSILFSQGIIYSNNLEWINYTKNNYVYGITVADSIVWVETPCGLVVLERSTGEIDTFFTTSNSGLPDSVIYDVAIDKDKNIWIGTPKGLAFYNGSEWKVYDKDNSGLPDNMVLGIDIDDFGKKWVIIDRKCLACFNDTSWVEYPNTSFMNGDEIAIDKSGKKWIGVNTGLLCYDDNNWIRYDSSNSDLFYNDITDLAIDSFDNIWSVSQGLGIFESDLFCFDGINWTLYKASNSGLPHSKVTAITIDNVNNKWFGTWYSGVTSYIDSIWTSYDSSNSGLPQNYIITLSADEDRNIWAGTGVGGVARFDGNNWTSYDIGLPANGIREIAIDRDGKKWIATDSGLVCFDGKKWKVYSSKYYRYKQITCLVIDKENNKWIGIGVNGLIKFDGTNWTLFDTTNSALPNNYPYNSVYCIGIDSLNNKWIGTGGGLVFYDDSNWKLYDTSNSGLINNDINCIAIDHLNNKWIGIVGGYNEKCGLAFFNGTEWKIYDSLNSDLPSNVVMNISIDSNNFKWIGTKKGISCFNDTNWTIYDTSNSGLKNNHVFRIAIDNNNKKWILSANSGLSNFDGTDWIHYDTLNSDIPSNSPNCLAIDNAGNKWMGTVTKGVAVFNEGGVVNTINNPQIIQPENLIFIQNYPNPFRINTTIKFTLPKSSHVRLSVFDMSGREVAVLVNKHKQAGEHLVSFSSGNLANGIYFYRLRSGDLVRIGKMVVAR